MVARWVGSDGSFYSLIWDFLGLCRGLVVLVVYCLAFYSLIWDYDGTDWRAVGDGVGVVFLFPYMGFYASALGYKCYDDTVLFLFPYMGFLRHTLHIRLWMCGMPFYSLIWDYCSSFTKLSIL